MTTIYRYRSVATTGPNGTDPRPDTPLSPNDNGEAKKTLTHLCEIDGWRYVSVPDGVIPMIPEKITTWEPATLTPALKEQIKVSSPYTRLIAQRVVDRIRAKYTIDDEFYIARISAGASQDTYTPSPDERSLIDAYQADVEAARAWGRAQRAMLGL